MLRARFLPPIPRNGRHEARGALLARGHRSITLLVTRGGAIGSEDLAQALADSRRLADCVWLRLDPADRETSVLAHAVSHALERISPQSAARFADEIWRRRYGEVAPEELARTLSRLLPGNAVMVLEDACGVTKARSFVQFGKAWSRLEISAPPVVVMAHGRPARRLRRLASPEPWLRIDVEDSFSAAWAGASAFPEHLADRLARVAAGRPALINDVIDAASSDRQDLVAQVIATAHNARDLMNRLTKHLLDCAQPDEIDVFGTALRLGYWHPDLGSLVDNTRIRPWLLPLQQDWHWLRPFWARPLAEGLRRRVSRRSRWWYLGPDRTSRRMEDGEGRCWSSTSRPPRLSLVTVRMLGPFELAVDGQPVRVWHGYLGPGVLKFLLARPKRACHRDVLLDVFWPSVPFEVARNRLQVALSGVRRSLEAVTNVQLIQFHNGNYIVGPSVNVELDVELFERLIESARQEEIDGNTDRAIGSLNEAVALYRDEFLADSPYEEWAIRMRESLRTKYLNLLDRLASLLLKQGRIGECIDIAQRILSEDMCREDAHRLLMRCYARQGRTRQALRQFDVCRQSVRDTLGVNPSPATIHLYKSLRAMEAADPINDQR